MLFNLEKLDRCKNIIFSSISYLLNLHLVDSDTLTKIINFLTLKFCCCCCSVTQSCLTGPHGQKSLVDYSLGGCKDLGTIEQLTLSLSVSIELVMPSNHLILCHLLLLMHSIFSSIKIFSNKPVLHIRRPKYLSFSFSISPSNEYSELISFRIDWFDLLAI